MKSEDKVHYGKIVGIGTQMMVMIALGWYVGYKLDEYLGNEKPLYTLIVGLGVMFGSMYLTVKQINKIFDKEK